MGVEWPLSNTYKVYSAYSPTIVEFIGEIIGEYLIRELLSTEKKTYSPILSRSMRKKLGVAI